jgi:hexokinase
MLSGMYLGEITRLVLKSLVEAGALLPTNRKERWRGVFSEPQSFATALMSQIAADKSANLDVVNTVRIKVFL